MRFKVADRVRFIIPGGPVMAVFSVTRYGVTCAYFHDGNFYKMRLPAKLLKLEKEQ